MKLLSPTQHKRLNEIIGFLTLCAGLVMLLSLVSYHTQDPSINTASTARPLNLIGYPGAWIADICYQVGLTSVGSFTTSFSRMFVMSAWAS